MASAGGRHDRGCDGRGGNVTAPRPRAAALPGERPRRPLGSPRVSSAADPRRTGHRAGLQPPPRGPRRRPDRGRPPPRRRRRPADLVECATGDEVVAAVDARRRRPLHPRRRGAAHRRAWRWAASSSRRSPTGRPCACSSPGRPTAGWRTGRGPRARCRCPVDPLDRPRRGGGPAARRTRGAPSSAGEPPVTAPAPAARPGRGCSTACSPARTSPPPTPRWAMREVMTGEATPAQVAGVRRRAARQGRVGRRRSPAWPPTMLDQATPVHAAARPASTSSAPAATARTPSTSPRWPPSSPRPPACRSPSTATGRRRRPPGAADVLEALGVVIDLPAAGVARCVQEAGIGFFFAPVFHPGMRHAGARAAGDGHRHGLQLPRAADQPGPAGRRGDRLRRPRGWRRCWPRCSPRAVRRALVFRGDDGLDELTTATTSSVWVVRDGEVEPDRLDPAALGIPASAPDALRGGDAGVQRRRVPARAGRASRGRCATRCCSTPPRRWPPSTSAAARLHDALARRHGAGGGGGRRRPRRRRCSTAGSTVSRAARDAA